MVWSYMAMFRSARCKLAPSKLAFRMSAIIHIESRIIAKEKLAPSIKARPMSAPFMLELWKLAQERFALRKSTSFIDD